MSLTKKQRQIVWDKSGGKCWYCGCDLPERGWHADHIEAVHRESAWVKDEERRCNLFKTTFSLEFFRKEIAAQVERARRSSVNFRTAERFGLIEASDVPVVFWFERQGLTAAGKETQV